MNRRGFRPVPVVATPPPSGIPVASTASVVISGLGGANGTYARIGTGANPLSDWVLTGYAYRTPNENFGNTSGKILFAPNSVVIDFEGAGTPQSGTPYSSWTLLNMYYDSEYDSWITESISTNASTDATNIPTTGWSPSLTIAVEGA